MTHYSKYRDWTFWLGLAVLWGAALAILSFSLEGCAPVRASSYDNYRAYEVKAPVGVFCYVVGDGTNPPVGGSCIRSW